MNRIKGLLNEEYTVKQAANKPLGEEMELFRQYNELLFKKLEKKMVDLEIANNELKKFEERYRLIFENATDVIFMIDTDLNILNISPSMERVLGYKPQDFIGRPLADLEKTLTQESLEQAAADAVFILKGETISANVYRFIAKDGTIKYGEVSGSPIMREGRIIGMISVARDITKRNQAEKALRESEDRFRMVAQSITDVIWEWNLNQGKLDWHGDIDGLLGYSPDEFPHTMEAWEKIIHPDDHDRVMKSLDTHVQQGKPYREEYRIIRKDGSHGVWLDGGIAQKDQTGKTVLMIGSISDITERKQMEDELRESEEKYRTILQSIEDGYFEVDIAGSLTFFNDSVCRILGNTRAELMGMNNRQYTDKKNSQILYQAFNKVYVTGKPSKGVDYEIIRKDGTKLNIQSSVSLIRNTSGEPTGFRGIMRNITEHKRMEEALRESEKLFRSSLENAPDGIYMNDLEGNFLYGNRKCEKITGYRREEMIGKNFLELNLLSENSLNKAVQLLQANMEGKSTGPDEIELVRKGGLIIPVEINTNVVKRMGQRIVLASVRDITKRKLSEIQLKQTVESLRKAFGATIQVIASTVETRDPYTAGHQIRSANLARAIATEMGLSPEKIEGVRVAGSIHDIGKLSIPAEILSKPTKLSEIEFSLLKEHARKGYEILKDVDSPWPLAEIIHQHHERMDGSGYPRNLKGEEILIEARILTVADVVEAMSSHRPYRPGLGIDAALKEIENNKGLFYDDAVADACLRLFREKGFKLEGA